MLRWIVKGLLSKLCWESIVPSLKRLLMMVKMPMETRGRIIKKRAKQ